ncbi:hypothetical protein BJX68DRAFT_245390 [Aspergillus pseudodeflectus]|uniref:Uncharacterized protein n=1 Tax=Aspergillus pseudodeflectus TaxID=176178 RepID=A0ABR4JRG3_9EURO
MGLCGCELTSWMAPITRSQPSPTHRFKIFLCADKSAHSTHRGPPSPYSPSSSPQVQTRCATTSSIPRSMSPVNETLHKPTVRNHSAVPSLLE